MLLDAEQCMMDRGECKALWYSLVCSLQFSLKTEIFFNVHRKLWLFLSIMFCIFASVVFFSFWGPLKRSTLWPQEKQKQLSGAGQVPDPKEWSGTRLKQELTCSANLPEMCEGYVNRRCCPSNSPTAVSFQHRPVDSPRFLVSDLCCCCFLLWAEFYTVCQSPERHTLEGPVEWDTKSDPSGEQLFFTTSHPQPPFVCLSLSSSLTLPHRLLVAVVFFFFLCLYFPPTPSTAPQTPGQVWVCQIPSVWRGYATSVDALSAWVVGQTEPTSPQHASQRVCA